MPRGPSFVSARTRRVPPGPTSAAGLATAQSEWQHLPTPCVAERWTPHVRRHRLPPQTAVESLFPKLPKPNPPLNLLFPSLESPSGYKNRARDPSAPYYLDTEHWNQPEKVLLGAPPWPPAIPSRASSFASSSALFLREVRSHCLELQPDTFISSNDARFRVLANSGDGATADLVTGVFSWPEHRPAHPDPIWAVYFESNGWY
jgi:hypothetical protein